MTVPLPDATSSPASGAVLKVIVAFGVGMIARVGSALRTAAAGQRQAA